MEESRHAGRVIYHLPTEGPLAVMNGGVKLCFYVSDGRTVVFDTEEGLARLIDGKTPDAPAWAADFKRVTRVWRPSNRQPPRRLDGASWPRVTRRSRTSRPTSTTPPGW